VVQPARHVECFDRPIDSATRAALRFTSVRAAEDCMDTLKGTINWRSAPDCQMLHRESEQDRTLAWEPYIAVGRWATVTGTGFESE
jgi:hypothetical protein